MLTQITLIMLLNIAGALQDTNFADFGAYPIDNIECESSNTLGDYEACWRWRNAMIEQPASCCLQVSMAY